MTGLVSTMFTMHPAGETPGSTPRPQLLICADHVGRPSRAPLALSHPAVGVERWGGFLLALSPPGHRRFLDPVIQAQPLWAAFSHDPASVLSLGPAGQRVVEAQGCCISSYGFPAPAHALQIGPR